MTPVATGTAREVMLTVTGEETYEDGHKDSVRTRFRAVCENVFEGSGGGTDGNSRAGYVFHYRETDPQSGAVTESAIGFSGGCGIMERKGLINTKMQFVPEKETECVYDTPYGSISLAISTQLVAVREVGDNFHARIRYKLTPDGGDPVECSVTIKAEPVCDRPAAYNNSGNRE